MGASVSNEDIQYNVALEGTKQKGFSHIYRNPSFLKELEKRFDPQITNMKDVIYRALKRFKGKDLYGKITVKTEKQGEAVV